MSVDAQAKVATFLRTLQQDIVKQLESLESTGPKFERHDESISESINTTTFLLQRTDSERVTSKSSFSPLERAFLALSFVKIRMPPTVRSVADSKGNLPKPNITFPPPGSPFYGAHLSVVIHPRSPHAPTFHGNWRYFEVLDSNDEITDWWYGGGVNLTPSYLYEEDCKLFHQTIKDSVSVYGDHTYEPMKQWCDEYFYHPIRKASEARGIGGIFFDGLSSKPHHKLDIYDADTLRPRSREDCLRFFESTGQAFTSAYIPILERRAFTPWTQEERHWQLTRRGRFVEFVLLADE
ncbi:Coproporphyrinogen-III oxidase [Ceratobasidium sp. 392]|nr:Coproporphyrinogen-III oxidase [Ceratobasidium sp. 392]